MAVEDGIIDELRVRVDEQDGHASYTQGEYEKEERKEKEEEKKEEVGWTRRRRQHDNGPHTCSRRPRPFLRKKSLRPRLFW